MSTEEFIGFQVYLMLSTVASIQNRWLAHLCYKVTYFEWLVAGFREMLQNFYLLIQTDMD